MQTRVKKGPKKPQNDDGHIFVPCFLFGLFWTNKQFAVKEVEETIFLFDEKVFFREPALAIFRPSSVGSFTFRFL